MIKRILVLALVLFCTRAAHAQGASYTAGPFSTAGLLYVCPVPSGGTPCPSPSSIYSNVGLTNALPNPLPVSAGQAVSFYVTPAQYTIQMPASGYSQVVTIGGGGGVSQVSSLPATCTPGTTAAVQLTVSPFALYTCTATNAWSSAGPGSGTGSGASPVMGYYFGSSCPVANTGQCFFTAANTQVANDCTWASSGPTVTCASSHFVAGDVGKRVMGFFKTDTFGIQFGCVAGRISFSSMTTGTLTISGFTSGTSITLSGNPSNTATGNGGCLIWGTPDDTNASTFETAYSAVASFCPKVMLSAAGYWFSSPHFSSQPIGCSALPSIVNGGSPTWGNMVYTAGFDLEGRGPGNTVIYLGPDFPNGDSCSRSEGNITNACFLVPTEGMWRDFQISGGAQLSCQVTANKILIGVSVGTLSDITLTNMCNTSAGGQIGVQADLLAQLYQVNNSGFGSVCLQTSSGTGYIQAFKLACENSPGTGSSGASVDAQAGSGTTPTFTCFGCLLLGAIASPNMNVVNVASTAYVHLIGTVIANCEAGNGCTNNTATQMIHNTGHVFLTDVTMAAQGGVGPTNVTGLFNAASGATSYVEKTVFSSASSGFSYADATGAVMVDLGGNIGMFSNPSANGAYVEDGRSLMFTCTGTANASVTNSLFGSGTNITATTCSGQTSTIGNGIPMGQARTISAVICSSSANTVSVACTVMKNGSTTSTTCTMTASKLCSNFTATAVAAGDLISGEIVTGAAETGANIHMQVIWQ